MTANGYTGNPPGSGGGGGPVAISDVTGLTAALAAKAPTASPTFTGTVAGVTKTHVGLPNVDNTSDAGKPVSTAQQTALDLKADASATTSALALKADASATTTALALKAPLASPTFTGTVAGVTAAMVGLGNVTNTSDAGKPVSTAQQAALDLKADLASPSLTGNPTAPTQTAGNNSTRLATTAFVTAAVAAGGGGGGSTLVVKRAVVSSGNVTPQDTGGTWAALTGGPTLVIPAAVGDYIAVELMALLMTPSTATFWDLAVLNGASLARFGSSGTGTPASEGDGSLYPDTTFPRSGTVFDFVAQAGDINGGNITICFATKSGGAGALHAGFYPLRWRILNHGAVTVS